MAKIVNGKLLRDEILEELKKKISSENLKPLLAIILVGENSSSLAYVKQKIKMGSEIGAKVELFQMPETITEKEIEAKIEKLNQDKKVTGIIVQLPLPDHLDSFRLTQAIEPEKDVDGLNETSSFTPATPLAVLKILESEKVAIKNKTAVVFGRSRLVGAPLKAILEEKGAEVIQINSQTPKEEVQVLSPKGDILVSAVGKAGVITEDLVKQNAVVIDVGISKNPLNGKLEGDVDFEKVKEKASLITPVPGGVGPLTVAMLLSNLVNTSEN